MNEVVPGFDARGYFLDAIAYQIIAGNAFGGQSFLEGVPNDDNLDVVFTTGALPVGLRFRVFAGGDSTAQAFVGPTFTGGTPITLTNRNAVKAANKGPPLSSGLGNVLTTDPGTLVGDLIFVPGGTGGTSTGGASFEALLILEPNTVYLIRTTNISGVANPLQMGFLFVEGKMSDRADPPGTTRIFL